jgi:hypothetical protein
MLVHQFQGSTALASARYNPEIEQLDVAFTSGRTYTHERVPPSVYEALVAASSPGRFYVQNIKGTY